MYRFKPIYKDDKIAVSKTHSTVVKEVLPIRVIIQSEGNRKRRKREERERERGRERERQTDRQTERQS